MTTFTVAAANAASFVLAQNPGETPVGPDFGKASPVGLLIIVVLAAAAGRVRAPGAVGQPFVKGD